MKTKGGIHRSDSKKTLQSQYLAGQNLDNSADMESADEGEQQTGTTAHMLKSKY